MVLRSSGPGSSRRWAVGATTDPDSVEFADMVRSAGGDWRPVTVAPERLHDAVRTLQPQLVFVDRSVPHHDLLLAEVREQCPPGTLIVNSYDLPELRFLMRAGHA